MLTCPCQLCYTISSQVYLGLEPKLVSAHFAFLFSRTRDRGTRLLSIKPPYRLVYLHFYLACWKLSICLRQINSCMPYIVATLLGTDRSMYHLTLSFQIISQFSFVISKLI